MFIKIDIHKFRQKYIRPKHMEKNILAQNFDECLHKIERFWKSPSCNEEAIYCPCQNMSHKHSNLQQHDIIEKQHLLKCLIDGQKTIELDKTNSFRLFEENKAELDKIIGKKKYQCEGLVDEIKKEMITTYIIQSSKGKIDQKLLKKIKNQRFQKITCSEIYSISKLKTIEVHPFHNSCEQKMKHINHQFLNLISIIKCFPFERLSENKLKLENQNEEIIPYLSSSKINQSRSTLPYEQLTELMEEIQQKNRLIQRQSGQNTYLKQLIEEMEMKCIKISQEKVDLQSKIQKLGLLKNQNEKKAGEKITNNKEPQRVVIKKQGKNKNDMFSNLKEQEYEEEQYNSNDMDEESNENSAISNVNYLLYFKDREQKDTIETVASVLTSIRNDKMFKQETSVARMISEGMAFQKNQKDIKKLTMRLSSVVRRIAVNTFEVIKKFLRKHNKIQEFKHYKYQNDSLRSILTCYQKNIDAKNIGIFRRMIKKVYKFEEFTDEEVFIQDILEVYTALMQVLVQKLKISGKES